MSQNQPLELSAAEQWSRYDFGVEMIRTVGAWGQEALADGRGLRATRCALTKEALENLVGHPPSCPRPARSATPRGLSLALDAWTSGFATALAEAHRGIIAAGKDAHLTRVARDAGLTIAEARRVGLDERDVQRLRTIGII